MPPVCSERRAHLGQGLHEQLAGLAALPAGRFVALGRGSCTAAGCVSCMARQQAQQCARAEPSLAPCTRQPCVRLSCPVRWAARSANALLPGCCAAAPKCTSEALVQPGQRQCRPEGLGTPATLRQRGCAGSSALLAACAGHRAAAAERARLPAFTFQRRPASMQRWPGSLERSARALPCWRPGPSSARQAAPALHPHRRSSSLTPHTQNHAPLLVASTVKPWPHPLPS